MAATPSVSNKANTIEAAVVVMIHEEGFAPTR